MLARLLSDDVFVAVALECRSHQAKDSGEGDSPGNGSDRAVHNLRQLRTADVDGHLRRTVVQPVGKEGHHRHHEDDAFLFIFRDEVFLAIVRHSAGNSDAFEECACGLR